MDERLRRLLARIEEQASAAPTEADDQLRRLQGASDEALLGIVRDRGEPSAARCTSLELLASRLCRERSLTEIVVGLLDDPDEELVRAAIRASPPFDPRMVDRIRKLLDDPRPGCRTEAASVLARRKDPKILPRLLAWLRDGDSSRFQVALDSLIWVLEPEDRLALLGKCWDRGGRDEEDRALLAENLLDLGDARGIPVLEDLAGRANGPRSAAAAVAVYGPEPAKGLALMRWVLDHGTPEARGEMVERIARLAGLPQDGTMDLPAETQLWIERAERTRDEPTPGVDPS